MNARRYLSKAQRHFLRDLPTYQGSLQMYLNERKIPAHRFGKWLKNYGFMAVFRATMRLVVQLREFNLQSAAQAASMKLSRLEETLSDEKAAEKFKILFQVIDIARPRPGARKTAASSSNQVQQNLGPDLSDERSQRLFRKLVDAHFEEVDKTAQ